MAFSTPFTVWFYTNTGTLPNLGGLLVCLDAGGCPATNPTYWNIIGAGGQQLFGNTVTDPSFGIPGVTLSASGSETADVNQGMSGYLISGGPFPFLYPPPSATPEPASLLLLNTGLCGLGIFTRKKLRIAKRAA